LARRSNVGVQTYTKKSTSWEEYMKFSKWVTAAAVMFGTAFAGSAFAQAPAVKTITVGTAGPGSIAFVWVSSMGQVLEQMNAPVRIRVAAGLFDIEAMRVMENHGAGVDASFVSGSSLVSATLGRPPFEGKPLKNLRGLFPIGTAPISIIARLDSGIRNVQDLSGKRLSAGPAGTGNDLFARAFFKRVVSEPVSWVPLSYSAFAGSLQDRKIDAEVVLGTHPYPAVVEAASLVDLAYLSITPEEQMKWLPDNPQHHKMTIPAGVYPKQDKEIVTFGHVSHLIASDKLDDATVEYLTKFFLDPEVRKRLLEISSSWNAAFDAASSGLYGEDVTALKLQMHPGALKVINAAGTVPGLPKH
jgi:TRAP transporter TAXI family solute receptor